MKARCTRCGKLRSPRVMPDPQQPCKWCQIDLKNAQKRGVVPLREWFIQTMKQ